MLRVLFKRLIDLAKIPRRGTLGSAGYDLFVTETVTINPGQWLILPLQFAIAIPESHLMWIIPKSGLSSKHGITVLNTPGTIDSDYRDGVGVIAVNFSSKPYTFHVGEKCAQAVFIKYEDAEFEVVDELPVATERTGGFGSTGK